MGHCQRWGYVRKRIILFLIFISQAILHIAIATDDTTKTTKCSENPHAECDNLLSELSSNTKISLYAQRAELARGGGDFDSITSRSLNDENHKKHSKYAKSRQERSLTKGESYFPKTERFSDYFDTVLHGIPKNDSDANLSNESFADPEESSAEANDDFKDANSTEEKELCVGHPDFCNLTKKEYIELLTEYIFPQPYEWVLIASHSLVFLVGLIGNALVCVAVYRNHSMRTVTNYFIVNLAVADFMVILFCLPPTVLWDVTETWFFGNAMCRIVLYFQSVSVTVSVLTLTFISVDRWYAICFPLKFKSTTGRAKTAIFVIWLLSLIFNIPEFVVLQTKKSSNVRFELDYFTQCAPTWSTDSDLTWHIIKAVFLYSLPLFLMTIAYCQIVRVLWKSDNIPGHCESHKYTSAAPHNWMNQNRRTNMSVHANASTEGQLRSRRKAAKMLVAVVVMFAVCYFPVHLISVLRYAFDMQQTDVMSFLALLAHWMCYANSAVNPLIYNFMSGKFRREFRRSFFKCTCFGYGPGKANGPNAQGIANNRGTVSRAGTRRSESCASYRLAHLSPSTYKTRDREREREFARSHTSFIENNNSNRKNRSDSVSENPVTRLTLATELDSRQ